MQAERSAAPLAAPAIRGGRALDAELTRMARFAGVDGVTYAEGWLRA